MIATWWIWALLACSDLEPMKRGGGTVETLVMDTPVHGLSGLTVDAAGTLWAVGERPATLVRLTDGTIDGQWPIEGWPAGVDAESITLAGDPRRNAFVVGGEGKEDGRGSDPVAWVVFSPGDGARVVQRTDLDWAAFDLEVEGNKGVEGMCALGDTLYLVGEQVKTVGEERLAPLARYEKGSWEQSWIRLPSKTGKLSALSCARDGESVRLWAIERHYKVLHLLTFTVGTDLPDEIEPIELAMPRGTYDPDRNVEGLVKIEGGFRLLTDDQHGPTRTESVLLTVPDP